MKECRREGKKKEVKISDGGGKKEEEERGLVRKEERASVRMWGIHFWRPEKYSGIK